VALGDVERRLLAVRCSLHAGGAVRIGAVTVEARGGGQALQALHVPLRARPRHGGLRHRPLHRCWRLGAQPPEGGVQQALHRARARHSDRWGDRQHVSAASTVPAAGDAGAGAEPADGGLSAPGPGTKSRREGRRSLRRARRGVRGSGCIPALALNGRVGGSRQVAHAAAARGTSFLMRGPHTARRDDSALNQLRRVSMPRRHVGGLEAAPCRLWAGVRRPQARGGRSADKEC
jgi:hypothetical protein